MNKYMHKIYRVLIKFIEFSLFFFHKNENNQMKITEKPIKAKTKQKKIKRKKNVKKSVNQ